MNNSYKALNESYKEYLQTLGFAETTVYDFPRFTASFLSYIAQHGTHKISDLEAKTVYNYFEYLQQKRGDRTKRNFGTSHLNRNFLAVDKFLEFLHHMGAQHTPTPTRYTIERTRLKELQVLTQEEVQELYKAIDKTPFQNLPLKHREPAQMTLQLVLDLCYGLGLRRSEAVNLKLKDIDFDQRIITVKQGKNLKDRFVPMSKQIYENLQTYVYHYRKTFAKRLEYVYPKTGSSLADTVEILVKYSDCQTLKAKNPTPHTLRHSIATHLLQNGMSIERIALFLGHSTLESTQLYTHILNEQEL